MWGWLIQGGWFMIPLTLCSIVGLAIIADRWLYIRAAKKEAEAVLVQIDQLAAKGDLDALREYCKANGGYISAIFQAGVDKYKQLQDEPNLDFVQHEVSRLMEDASIANMADLEQRLPLLGTVGNVAPLFGFAGTVTGMINAFKAISMEANPSAQTVAAGIYEALITTAAGLAIAIPVVLFYNFFTGQIDAINARVEESANNVIDTMVMNLVSRRKSAA